MLVTGALTLGFLSAPPAAAAPGELIARNGAFYEYNDAVVRVALARRVNHGLSVGYRTVSRSRRFLGHRPVAFTQRRRVLARRARPKSIDPPGT